jgi:hypothetical protein
MSYVHSGGENASLIMMKSEETSENSREFARRPGGGRSGSNDADAGLRAQQQPCACCCCRQQRPHGSSYLGDLILLLAFGIPYILRMRWLAVLAVALPSTLAAAHDVGYTPQFGSLGQNVNRWLLRNQIASGSATTGRPFVVQDGSSNAVYNAHKEFEERWFEQPLDHFSNDTRTFRQRYWINTRHYNATKGGPVFVLDGGETSGRNRLPFLDTGIMDILPKATGGIGVILEHRYYGLLLHSTTVQS